MADEKEQKNLRALLRRMRSSQDLAIKAGIVGGAVLVLALMFPRGESIELDYKVGAVWTKRDLVAPFSFSILRDEHEYEQDVAEAKARVYPVFERDPDAVSLCRQRIEVLFARINETLALQAQPLDTPAFDRAAAKLPIRFTRGEWNLLAALNARRKLHLMQNILAGSAEEFLQAGMLDREKRSLTHSGVAVRKGNVEEIIPLEKFLDRREVDSLLDRHLIAVYRSDNDTVDLAHKIGTMLIEANIKFNRAATSQSVVFAVEAVQRTAGIVQEGERLVSKNERITPEAKQKLDSFRRAKAERTPDTSGPWQLIGIVMHVSSIALLFGIYLFLFRKRIIGNNLRLALLALLIVMQGVFAYLSREINVTAPLEYLILVPAASMLLTILFDSRVGFYGTVTVVFIVAGIRGNDYGVAITSLVAGALAVYTVRDVKNRTQIFRSLGFIFLGYALSIVALALERFEPGGLVLEQLTLALANSFISPVLTYGLLLFFEKYFKITTELTLIELSRFDHPLLRRLSERAPGTYHHSMTMASLAEAGAAAVNASVILARAGALFHDIGKVEKPTYFVENMKGSRNRHDKLAPRMSSLIIANHVREGMELAYQHKLPQDVVDFIPMHHGTTRMEYFYQKALRVAESSDDETKKDEINEQDYRYPGPRPQTKETGILMLADAIEAAVRTIDEPTPQRLEGLIDELIRKRFEEGELDECPLTLKDLTKIKQAFLGVLVGIYHARVKYPETEPEDKRQGKPDTRKSTEDTPAPAEQGAENSTAGTAADPATPSGGPVSATGVSDAKLSRTINEIDKQ